MSFSCLFFMIASGQDRTNYLRTDLISPSPTAASIERYGNISVNPSSGSANLSIPIFNVTGLELSLPISLSYGYSGLRPAENAGWVGLGWTLQAGGVITRNIRGKVDYPNDAAGFSSTYVSDKIYNGLTNPQTEDFQTFLENVFKGNYDTEPDIYNFNFPGHSGKFIIYKGVTYCYPDQKLKIANVGGTFVIVAEDGTQYIFDATETTRSKANANAQYNLPPYTSAYYLTEIRNVAQSESIQLSYVQEAEITQIGPLTQSYKKYSSFQDQSILYDPVNSYPTFVAPLRLSQITSEKYRVNFYPEGQPRTDLNGVNYALNGISVIDRDNPKEIKYFRFNHGYFGTNAYLKLLSLEENISGDLHESSPASLKHTFEYEESLGFPTKPALGADHYGYYNGGYSDILIPGSIYPSGPDRDPKPLYAQQGALKKITYPTGGYTVFSYEGNKTFNGKEYKKKENGKMAQAFVQGSQTIPFVLESEQEVSVSVERYPLMTWDDGNIRGDTDFEIYNSATGQRVMWGRVVSQNANPPFTQILPAGSYTLVALADRYENELRATINYWRLTDSPIEGKPVGGIRVAMVKDFPLVGLSTIKEYKYTDEKGFSTGTSSPVPIYSQSNITEVIEESTGYRTRHATVYSSSISENDYSGVPSFYSSVTENNISANVKTVTRSEYAMGNYFNAQPYLKKTTIFKTLSSGGLQPIKCTTNEYRQVSGNSIISIKPEQTLDVALNGSSPIWGYAGPLKEFVANITQYDQGWEFAEKTKLTEYFDTDSLKNETVSIYDLSRKNLQMTKQTTSGGSTIITKYKYAEDYVPEVSGAFVSANFATPVWEKQIWKKNLSDSLLVALDLTVFNSQFRPATIYSLDQSGLTSLNNESRSGLLYNNLLSDTRLTPQAHFYYDVQGHLVSQKQEAGVPVSYQWGYGASMKHYPVAEVKNATESEFFTENFEDNPSEQIGTAHSGIRFHNGSYNVSWNVPNAKPYVIGYYYLSGTDWKYKTESFVSGNHTLSGGSAYDDIRVFPADAQVTSFTYLTGIGKSSVTDSKGLTQYYEYDNFNRLASIKDNNGRILKSYSYGFRNADGKFYNTEISAGFNKNNCSGAVTGSRVFYTIAAGSYVSTVSQADADAQAAAALQAGGQAYANANGTCGETVLISVINNTAPLPTSGLKSAYISTAEFRNTVTGVVYTFNDQQIAAGISLPKGIYNIEFEITGSLYSADLNLGWSLLTLTYGSNLKFLEYYSDYYMKNVNLNLETATLQLSAQGGIE